MGERSRRGGVRHYHGGPKRIAWGGPGQHHERDPHYVLAEKLTEALDPVRAPGEVKTLADMTQEERAEMARLYARKP